MLCVYQQPPPQPLPRPLSLLTHWPSQLALPPALQTPPHTQHNCGVTAIPIHCLSLLVQPLHSGGWGGREEQEGEGLMFAFTSIRRNLISLLEAVSPPPLLRLDIFIACRHIRSTPTAGGGIF